MFSKGEVKRKVNQQDVGAHYTPEGAWRDPASKAHGANMGPTWGRQDTGGPHVGHMNLAIWETTAIN